MLEYTGIHDYYLKRKVLKNSTLPNGMLQLSKIAHHGYHGLAYAFILKLQNVDSIPRFLPFLSVHNI